MDLKWTDEMLAEEAKKYSTRMEFKKECHAAYKASCRIGKYFMDMICSHMKSIKWKDKELQDEAKKYGRRIDFQNNSNGAYLAALRKGKEFLDKICAHMEAYFKWTEKLLAKEAWKYETRLEFSRESSGAYKAALSMGIMDKICEHMASIYWTDKELQDEAEKYSTRGKFRRGHVGAYLAARKRGKDFLDKICAHMIEGARGFKRSAGGFLYQFRVVRGMDVYYKVGITNGAPDCRASYFGIKDGVYIERTHAIWFECGAACRKAEKALHTAAKAKGLQYIGKDLMKNGFTEIFTQPLLH